ncbi:hypothetical protein AB0I82_18410 [Streptomyces sp. NPDC050315]|uniref:hypothetical protein n=1 Tax=Streptomyces sp. NPDC050315 TaxID=3155039 RepID=UPI003417B697
MSRSSEAQTIERSGFHIKVPKSWWEFDIRPASRDDTIRQLVNERVRQRPELAEHRDAFSSFLRKAAKDAWQSGALYCGCMAESYGGAAPVTASVTVSVIGARTDDGEILPTDPQLIAQQISPRKAKREGDAWREVTTVKIPQVGTVARTHGIEDIAIPGDERTVRAVLMQTFIPVPEQQGTVALVSGSSQVLDLADSFFDMFDAITSTFRFT